MGNFGRAEILAPFGCRGAALGIATPHPATITRVLALLGAEGGVPYLLAAAPMGEYFQNGRTVPVTFIT